MNTAVYRSLKWCYQPIKLMRLGVADLACVPRRRRILRTYFSTPGFKGLQIGTGRNYREGWLNTDLLPNPSVPHYRRSPKRIDFPLDMTKPFPFETASLDAIYGEEVIEHISRADVKSFLREAQGALRVGGVLRLSTPDLNAICRMFLGLSDDARLEDYEQFWYEPEWSKEIWINAMFLNWGHQFVWSFDALKDEMLQAGFSGVLRCEPKQTRSDIPQLDGLDQRYQDAPLWYFSNVMIIEATK